MYHIQLWAKAIIYAASKKGQKEKKDFQQPGYIVPKTFKTIPNYLDIKNFFYTDSM